jgi:hypothetical protein
MCSNPITFRKPSDGQEAIVACRVCDACIATRRHGWVARAMAEKATSKFTLCLALTYDNSTQENRDASAMFAYSDINGFLKRLRSAARHAFGASSIRFLCAGEQGDRNGRCHWHMIIFSDVDILKLGVISLRGSVLTDSADLMTIGKRKRRCSWSIWGKGFVTFQEPDQGGMNYVLSYCLKDQFTVEKSRGTARESKAENFATGLFRMSKYPPIGDVWLMRKLEGLLATGSVLPSLNLVIPDFRGFWYPSGLFREKLIWGLVALNKRVLWSTGANAPQWSSLLASCSENQNDLEILNAPQQKPESSDDFQSLENEFSFRTRETVRRQVNGEFIRRCGNSLPCWDCLHQLDFDTLFGLGLERFEDEKGVWQYRPLKGAIASSPARGINPYCYKRGSKAARFAFPDSGRSFG